MVTKKTALAVLVRTVLLACVAASASAQPATSLADSRSGDIQFNSFQPRGHHELAQGTFDRKPVAIQGKLLLPAAQGRVPAIVIGHTVGGVQPFLFRWAKALNDAGYAAFVVDSFSSRGLSRMWTRDSGEFNGAFLVADAFSALRLLSTHPAIDPDRIAFLGFSMGGFTAHYVIHEKFRASVLGDSPLRFAASVAHYPGCHYNFFESNMPSQTPLFLFLGEKDDWTPAAQCTQYAQFLAAKGYKVTAKVYDGAGHGYDEDRPVAIVSDALTQAACEPLAVDLAQPVLAPMFIQGGQPLAPGATTQAAALRVYQWAKACTSRGASGGVLPGPGDRRNDATRDTLGVLREAFRR